MPIVVFLILLCVGCSRNPDTRSKDGSLVSLADQVKPGDFPIESLRHAAGNDEPEAQRELAKRLLFGQGVAANPTEALVWTKRAAANGDETASLWVGRAALNDPPDRVEACAWFLVATEALNTAVRQDALAEIETLAPSKNEISMAVSRAAELKRMIRTKSK